jgi:hypothetical protein
MLVMWLGAALALGGILFLAFQAIWRGPLSERRRSRSAGATLEPRTPGPDGVFGLKANWLGFVLIGLGAILLVAGAAFWN